MSKSAAVHAPGRGDSDGRFDFDFLGIVQWLAAWERPPHVVCIAPIVSSGRLFDEIPYLGGAFRLDCALSWNQRGLGSGLPD